MVDYNKEIFIWFDIGQGNFGSEFTLSRIGDKGDFTSEFDDDAKINACYEFFATIKRLQDYIKSEKPDKAIYMLDQDCNDDVAAHDNNELEYKSPKSGDGVNESNRFLRDNSTQITYGHCIRIINGVLEYYYGGDLQFNKALLKAIDTMEIEDICNEAQESKFNNTFLDEYEKFLQLK